MLDVKDLWCSYGQNAAVKGVSLEVGEGEIVCLLGSNGAGKTTTLMAVSGVVKPKQGRISFRGTDLTGRKPSDIVKLGVSQVPEGRRIFGGLTVLENLKAGAYARADRNSFRQELDFVFSLFPILAERTRQDAGTLSGGEQQMLALGRALMSKPKLLLLDEPSLGLAPLLIKQVFGVMEDIRKAGIAILLVEQNAQAAWPWLTAVTCSRPAGLPCRALRRSFFRVTRSGGRTWATSRGTIPRRCLKEGTP